jgi:5-methylcytosine-specific restriction protein A
LPYFEKGLPEGAKTRVEVNKYERSSVNRAVCIAKFGAVCQVCGLDFGERYGDIAEGYIEVHHIVPVSQMAPGYIVNPLTDLIPLCANCHAVVHRLDPPLPIDSLRALLRREDK